MFSAARAAPLTRSGPRPLPIALSVIAHAGLFSLVALGPRPSHWHKPRSLYDEVIRPHEHQLVWYSFRQKLPEVSPQENESAKPPGAEIRTPDQTIVSNPKRGDPATQMIWRPAPRIVQPPVASPNILAFRMPLIAPPPPGPPRKLFNPPQSSRKPSEPAPLLPAPPLLAARVTSKLNPLFSTELEAALATRPKARAFVPPAPRPEIHTAPVALPEAPAISSSLRSARVPLLAESMAAPLANRPQPRKFIPPPTPGRAAASPVALPDAPKVATQLASASGATRNLALQDGAAAALANKPEPRNFIPPPAKEGGSGSRNSAPAPPIEDAPSLDSAAMPSANVNVAIVGLNPAPKLIGPLPEASRDARFSAGPEAADSHEGAAGSSSALSVPGLLVRGGRSNSTPVNPVLVARAAPTSREMLEAAMKAAVPASNDPPSAEIHLVPPPDSEFNGRAVYSLAVQMPNISSYVGSWIMWFSERQPVPRGGRGLHPPIPIHKVDPKYLPAAISERIQGKVQLAGVIRVNGRVDQLRVLKGVDPRIDRSAQEALLKWEFMPAERNGRPVEVDLVAEIPFLLAPQVKR